MARKKKETTEDNTKLQAWRETAQKLLNWAAGADFDPELFAARLEALPGALNQLQDAQDSALEPLMAAYEAERAKYSTIEECLVSAKDVLSRRVKAQA